MRVAVVAARWGDSWDEEQLFARRVAGALASEANVDVLVGGHDPCLGPADGALTVRQFAADGADPRRHARLARFTVDTAGVGRALSCSCGRPLLEIAARRIPESVQTALVKARDGYSPALYSYLADSRYDVVVLAGSSALLAFGLRGVPRRSRVVVTASPPGDASIWVPIFDGAYRRADVFLAATEVERETFVRRGGNDDAAVNVGFALRVSRLSADTAPVVGIDPPYVLAVGDWTTSVALQRLFRDTARLARDLPDLKVVFAGRGNERIRRAGRMTAYGTDLRSDLWRWMSRAAAVLDAEPGRMLGRDVLEAFLYGVPVLVSAVAGAGREHAQAGNGGLWYRNYIELVSAIELLGADGVGETLGRQGREYAQRVYGDPARFRQRVVDACLG